MPLLLMIWAAKMKLLGLSILYAIFKANSFSVITNIASSA